jgi:hypothetical protein
MIRERINAAPRGCHGSGVRVGGDLGKNVRRKRPSFPDKAAVLLAALFVLGDCSGATVGSAGLFPSPSGYPTAASASTETPIPAQLKPPSMDDNCPTADIRAGAGTLALGTKGQPTSASDVRYQLSFTEIARQCTLVGTTVNVKVGVQGRAIVGPAGAPNEIDIPLRYAVVREGVEPKTITTTFRRVPLSMPPGATNVTFIDVAEDLSFPLPPTEEFLAYVIYVGFDPIGNRNDRRPPPAGKKGKAK